ncbi:hypothetical protein GCM10011506_08760 [Marivirga lumbricoides]|uniref:Beta-lactamase-related domain-containing protein n=1 Tax=Marivirga lumbricoides TaxID=1046115 RepID=A0ABQ1LKK0_9BACT|nr:hypothetical protein GCM10011506_08760 [Marivirga lumbricoides]
MNSTFLDFTVIIGSTVDYFISISLLVSPFYKNRANKYLSVSLFILASITLLGWYNAEKGIFRLLQMIIYDKNTPLPVYGLESFPDGGLRTSNEDMMKYMIAMIAGQRGEESLLFKESYYDLLFAETSSNYSIFWDIDPGVNAFGHSGGDPGISSEFHFSGPGNAGFFILSNYDGVSSDKHYEHYDAVMDDINESINMFFSN